MIEIVDYIAKGVSLASLAVILYGCIGGLISFVRNEFSENREIGIRKLRVSVGTYILLGLEFLIAADIIITIMEPSYEELIILAGIVILRTVLSVFLNKEIHELEDKKQ